VGNVDGLVAPGGGVWLFEAEASTGAAAAGGGGKLYVDFANFSTNPHHNNTLAWDACGAGVDGATLAFDNGHPIQNSTHSQIGSFVVEGAAEVRHLPPPPPFFFWRWGRWRCLLFVAWCVGG
jgi:hypothetical protein